MSVDGQGRQKTSHTVLRERESYTWDLGSENDTWASPDVGQNLLHQRTLAGAYVNANLAWPLFRRFALSGNATEDDFGLFVDRLRLS